jgi:MFS family permease
MILFSFTSILAGLKDELGLSNTQFGLLLSAFSIAYAAAQMPAGILSDRYGGKRVSLVGLFLMAVAALAFSFSTDFEVALFLRCLAGFGGGLVLPAAIRLLSDWYPPKDRNIAMGIFGLGQGLGFVVTYVIGSIVVEFLGWRTGSLFSGTIVSLVVVLALIFLKENAAAAIAEKQPGSSRAEGKFKLPFFLFIAINFTSLSVVSGILQFTPQFLTVRFGFSTIASGFVTSLMGLTSMLSSFAGGLTSRKIGGGNVILASMLMCAAFPALLGYSYYPASVLAFVALLGFGTLFYFGPLFAGVSSMGEKHRGAVFGVFNTTSFGASALSPLILGYVLDTTHRYEAAFTSLSVIALIGLGAAVALKRTKFFADD